ncbi:MAG: hypothetical protein DELT_03161 [Desulfovibrio sp.]
MRGKINKRILAAAALLLCGSLLAGCQPTPEKQAVVQKKEDIPVEAVPQPDGPTEHEAHYAPMQYQVSEHWKEDITKDENFTVNADVDVEMPEAAVYPVQELSMLELTQERADGLIAYFAGGDAEFYQMPLPMTKADWEERILELRQSLAEEEANGHSESAEELRNYIDEAEKSWANAPEENKMEPADTKFTYQLDYDTGEPMTEEGENYINLAVKSGDGINRVISASRANAADGTTYFSYRECMEFERESTTLMQEEANAQDRAAAVNYEEPSRSEELERIDKEDARIASLKEKYAQNDLDMEAMQQKAVGILEEMGVTGVQIENCEKALYELNTQELTSAWGREYTEPAQEGCFIEFGRECGGIPCVAQSGGHWGPGMSVDGMYSAPFYPESGYMLLDADGKIREFSWANAAQVDETRAQDSSIIPFDEAKERLVDHLYWYNMPQESDLADPDAPKYKFRFEVEEAKLVMAYVNVKDEPDKVLAVPAWYIRVQGYVRNMDRDTMEYGDEIESNGDEVMVNALDGSPILMPGMERMMQGTGDEGA